MTEENEACCCTYKSRSQSTRHQKILPKICTSRLFVPRRKFFRVFFREVTAVKPKRTQRVLWRTHLDSSARLDSAHDTVEPAHALLTPADGQKVGKFSADIIFSPLQRCRAGSRFVSLWRPFFFCFLPAVVVYMSPTQSAPDQAELPLFLFQTTEAWLWVGNTPNPAVARVLPTSVEKSWYSVHIFFLSRGRSLCGCSRTAAEHAANRKIHASCL